MNFLWHLQSQITRTSSTKRIVKTAGNRLLLTKFHCSFFAKYGQSQPLEKLGGRNYCNNGSQQKGLNNFRQRTLSFNFWTFFCGKKFTSNAAKSFGFFRKQFFLTVTLGNETSGGNLPLQTKMEYYQAKKFFPTLYNVLLTCKCGWRGLCASHKA